MALATQCPHCQTTFRVAHDQLKLRAGLVRCGACKQIFNGIENLLRAEEAEQLNQSAAVPPPAAAAAEAPGPVVDTTPAAAETEETATGEVEDSSAAKEKADAQEMAPAETPGTEAKDDPLLRMTLMDFAYERSESPPVPAPASEEEDSDPVEQAIDDLQSKPWREPETNIDAEADPIDQADAAEYEEPSFVRQGRRRQRIGRALRIFMAVASVILLLGLLVQSAYVFRNQIAAWLPQTKPLLVQACTRIGCQVGLPMQIDAVSIESSELQALSADSNSFSLTVLLRNHSATAQAWPNLELTLNDAAEKPLVRRVFLPRGYLPNAQEFNQGFASRSEQTVKLFFELAQLKAAGYRVYVFYP